MEIKRQFTQPGLSPYDQIRWKNFPLEGWPNGVEAPELWSETAVEIAATKYFRRRENEHSVKHLIERVVGAIVAAGYWQGYFSSDEAAETFGDELRYILLNQIGSFNSPVYFNVGIFPTYSVMGNADNFVCDEGRVRAVGSAYVRPQASACFIQDVQDDLLSIFDLLKAEAKLFKYGSGTGTNFSRLRAKGEPLDSGGESTGLLSYLEVFDKAAHAIKSGGTTRRAAKMVVLDADHPEIMEFIDWKMNEERKARVLLANGYSGGMEGEAFRTVSGQNSNNSVRVSDAFLKAAQKGGDWALRWRKNGAVAREIPAATIWREIARAAWECADPGLHFQDTIQKWHMCPRSGEIRSSNPCSEYLFLDNSACNLASLNLVRFLKNKQFDWASFDHSARLLLLAQDILVDYASYPTAAIAENSHRFRPLGLGYANLGGLLMRMGISYDSEAAGHWTAKITGALHAIALHESVRMAEHLGAFAAWMENRDPALNVIRRHNDAWLDAHEGMDWVDKLYHQVQQGAEKFGLRNAQVTLIAPTGTIGLFMDCDTLGIEPDFALVKRKHLSGGGEMLLVNHAVPEALAALGYGHLETEEIVRFVLENGHIVGAPGLKSEHLPIFDCAIAPSNHPERRVTPHGHLRVMAAAQPFLSGGISKTVNLPHSVTVEDVQELFLEAWRLGLKSIAIYRDGSKTLQPLCAEC